MRRDEIDDVLVGEGVVERQHRHRVADFLEAAGGRGADLQRQRFQRPQVGKARLDGVVARAQRVVFGVRYARPVLLVIAPVVLGYLDLQPRVLGLRLLGGEQFDGRLVGFDFGFGHARNLKVWMAGNKLAAGPAEAGPGWPGMTTVG